MHSLTSVYTPTLPCSVFLFSVFLLHTFAMGVCSSQMNRKNANYLSWRPIVMVIDCDGRLEEFKQPIRAGHILQEHPSSFLCSCESMYVDSIVPAIPEDEELELGQIYFVLPLSQLHIVLTLQDLCGLAIKASLALGFTNIKRSTSNINKLMSQARSSCRILSGLDAIGVVYPPARRGSRRIEL